MAGENEQMNQQEILQQQIIVQQDEAVQEQVQAEPIQEQAQQQEQGEALAERIIQGLPTAEGDAMPAEPQTAAAQQQQAQAQAQTKSERRAQQKAEREQRRQAERERKENERIRANEEKKRLRERKALLQGEVRERLNRVLQSQSVEEAKAFFLDVGNSLFEQKKDAFPLTADFAAHMSSYKLLLAEHVASDDTRADLLGQLAVHEENFRQAQRENVLSRIIYFYLKTDMLMEECKWYPFLEDAAQEIMEAAGTRIERARYGFGDFERDQIIPNLDMAVVTEDVFEMPELKQLGKKATREQFDRDIRTRMAVENCSYEEAQERELELRRTQHLAEVERQALRERAERERLDDRARTLENPAFAALLEQLKQSQNEEERKAILLDMARIYLPGHEGEFQITADYTKKLDSYKLLIADHVDDPAMADTFLEAVDAFRERFMENQELNVLNRIISMGFPYGILAEEFSANPDLMEAVNAFALDFDERNMGTIHSFEVFTTDTLLKFLPPLPEEAGESVFEAPEYKRLSKKPAMKEFRDQTQRVMERLNISEAEAERLVLSERREKALAKRTESALERTRAGGVVAGLSDEAIQEHGMSSFHYTLRQTEAEAAVQKSNGFLYAKYVGDDLFELRPTLPEQITVGGKTIQLRRSYNIMTKAIGRMLLEEDGNLRPGAFNYTEALAGELGNSFVGQPVEGARERLSKIVSDFFAPAIRKFLEGDAADAAIAELTDALYETAVISEGYVMATTLLPREICDSLTGFVHDVKLLGAPLIDQLESTRKEMLAKNEDPEKINEKLLAIIKMYRDAEAAMEEFRKLRDIDPDAPDVALPNACSANADFLEGLTAKMLPQRLARTRYMLGDQKFVHPEAHLDHVRRLYDPETTDPKLRAVAHLIDKNPQELTREEIELLGTITDAVTKYEYHDVGTAGEAEDGELLTIETFAATTTQFVVSPFSSHAAVGIYRSREGIAGQYNSDDPLPGELGEVLTETRRQISRGELPGQIRG